MPRVITLIGLIVLVVALSWLFIQVMIGFLLPLFVAVLLAILFRPLHMAIARRLHGRQRIAAGITTLLIMLIVLTPIVLVTLRAAQDAAQYVFPTDGPRFDRNTFKNLIGQINERFDLHLDPKEALSTVASTANEWLSPIARKTPGLIGSFLINGFVIVFALYYFLADGEDFVAAGTALVPLDAKYQNQLITRFVEMSRAVTTATLVTALVQGILASVGYYFAGFEGVILLLILTVFAAFVPIVGSSIVWVPCSIWLLAGGHTMAGVSLAAWCLAVALATDNLLKPAILRGQANLHPLLGLLSVLGGVAALGPIGIFVGPMAVAFLQTGLRMLNLELDNLRKSQAKPH